MSGRMCLAIACALAALGVCAQTARAQTSPAAESEFKAGKEKMRAGRIAEACDHFDASQKLESNLATLASLADCREKNGQLASAWGAWVGVRSQTRDDKKQATLHRTAVQRADALEPRLSYLTINVPDESRVEGLTIRRDGEEVAIAVWNRAVPVDGGSHTIEGKAPGHEPWSTTVEVEAERDQKSVEVPKFKALPKLIELEKPTEIHNTYVIDEPSPWTTRRKVAVGVAGGGAALIVVGAVLGFQAQTLRDDAENACPPEACGPGDAERANDLNDRSQKRALFANVAFGAGGAALIGGAVLWYLGAPVTPTVDEEGDLGVAFAGTW
jgi:hypothetical protein